MSRSWDIRFIDIRDTNGRQSGFTVMGDMVLVRGVLEHNTEFTADEFRKLAKQIENTLDTGKGRAYTEGVNTEDKPMRNVAERLSELDDEHGQVAADAIEGALDTLNDLREELETKLYNAGLTEDAAERLSYRKLNQRAP